MAAAASSTFNASSGEDYERLMGRWSRRLAGPFLAFTGLLRGERVLDVGCGTGSLTRQLLQTADVTVDAIDYAAPYVAHAEAAIRDARVCFRVGDACALPYDDRSFDRVLALLVLQFVPDPERALAEMRRVARAGATIGAAVWDSRGGFVANRMFLDTAAAIEPGAAELRSKRLVRPMTRPGDLEAAWRRAGLGDIEGTELTIRMTFASFDDYWAPYTSKDGPLAAYVGGLDEATRTRVREAIRAAFLDGEPDGPRSYAATAFAVKGVVP